MNSGDWPVYDFDYVHDCSVIELRQRLGSKGAGLVEMRQQLGLPVPHGFVLGAALCSPFLASGWLDGLDQAIDEKLAVLERTTSRRFGGRETVVAGPFGKPRNRRRVGAEIEDSVHHPRHRDWRARSDRHQQRPLAPTEMLRRAAL